ncbi:putative helicase [Trypanosoma grayi]|uniref:putative helicase n=1 Tax=Trypanosoma grayi TaxID=71804 RepID=UPI0004F47464|nr:putative helicase [Trypanosoma grayi]KEG09284.1 putative helicase [Trypanosoma grayi]
MDDALLALLQGDDAAHGGSLLGSRQAVAKAFEAALLGAVGIPDAEAAAALTVRVRAAAATFLAAPTPGPLEMLLVRVVTLLHAYSVVCAPASVNGGTAQLPARTREAAIALSAALFSRRLRTVGRETDDGGNADAGEDDGDDGGVPAHEYPLWYCFLYVFLQQLSARGDDFTLWKQFFRECKAECEKLTGTQGISEERESDHDDNDFSRSEHLGTKAWGLVSTEMFDATVLRTRFRRSAIVCKSFCPHLVAQAPGTTYQLRRTLHAFMSEWEQLQRQNSIPSKEAEAAVVARYGEELGRLLGEGQVHSFLLATVIGAVLSSTYIFSRRAARGQDAGKRHESREDTSTQMELRWRQAHYPPIGRLLDHLHIRPLLAVHLYAFCMQVCIGLSPTHYTEARQKLALCLYLTEVSPLCVALAVYHYAATATSQPSTLEWKGGVITALPGEELASFTLALNHYVQEARNELYLVTVEAGPTRRRPSRHSSSSNNNNNNTEDDEPLPVNGELQGPRFARTVFPVPCPTWSKYLVEEKVSTGGANKPTASGTGAFAKNIASTPRLTPLQFVLELLELGLPGLAADTITQLQVEMKLNVCLVPAAAMPSGGGGGGNIATNVMRRLQVILEERTEGKGTGGGNDVESSAQQQGLLSAPLRALEAYYPLLSTIHAYVASQEFLCSLVEGLTRECGKFINSTRCNHHDPQQQQQQQYHPSEDEEAISNMRHDEDEVNNNALCRGALGLAESYLIHVIMPCLRVIAPSPILYDRIQGLLLLLKVEGPVVHFGSNPVEFLHISAWMNWLVHPPTSTLLRRAPHDTLRSKELESLFTQSLKRMTAANVARYASLLRPAIYANPLLVAEKLFQQAVGYGNNFLPIHTQLLKGAPAAVMTLIAHEGLALMRRYAEKERIGTTDANRVGLIATFLAVLWRDNPRSFDGGLLLRAAEYALRREARASIVFGLELLRSILHELLDYTLEHEEQYSVAQVQALISPAATQWFVKGAAESFRRGRWDACLTPAVLAASASLLRVALQERCVIPVESQADMNEDEEAAEQQQRDAAPSTVEFTLGQSLLLHLCRLHSRIYAVQADLAAPMQTVLLTCARDNNVINDLLLCVEGLLPQGPPVEEIYMLAMPHVALRLTARFAAKAVQSASVSIQQFAGIDALFTVMPSDVSDHVGRGSAAPLLSRGFDGVIPFALLQKLSCYTAAHFVYDESVYKAAVKEVNEFFNHATARLRSGSDSSAKLTSDPTIRWLQEQTRQIRLEKEAYQRLYQQCEDARATLLDELRRGGVLNAPVAFAKSYLLPRALLSLEDTLFVYHFLKWLLDATRADGRKGGEYERAVDIVLSLVTAVVTFFVGFTDGECKRLGFLLSLLLAALHEGTEEMPSSMCGSNNSSAVATDTGLAVTSATTITKEALMACLEPKPRSLMSILEPHATPAAAAAGAEKCNKKEDDKLEEGETKFDDVPAHLVQLEAYLCRSLVQLLVHQKDILFLHRNTFLILERLTKTTPAFPSTLCATEWLISAVAPHAVRSSSSYASATAVLKVLQDNQQRKRQVLRGTMSAPSITHTLQKRGRNSRSGGDDVKSAAERQTEAWRNFLKTRETYVRLLLNADMAAAEARRAEDVGREKAQDEEEEELEVMAAQAGSVDDGDAATERSFAPTGSRNDDDDDDDDGVTDNEMKEAEEEEEEERRQKQDEEEEEVEPEGTMTTGSRCGSEVGSSNSTPARNEAKRGRDAADSNGSNNNGDEKEGDGSGGGDDDDQPPKTVLRLEED